MGNTTGNNGSNDDSIQEDKMVVYVDELDEDYFDVNDDEDASDDESSGDDDGDDDDDKEGGLDHVDTIFKSSSTYDLTDDVDKPLPPVTAVSIKNSNTFSHSDRGILMRVFFSFSFFISFDQVK